jgi:hypothetical protein
MTQKFSSILGSPLNTQDFAMNCKKSLRKSLDGKTGLEKQTLLPSKEMLNFLCKQAQKESNPNSLTASLADWLTLALYTGLRLSEYCQYSTHTNRGTIAYNMDNEPKAFLAQDFRFFVADEHTISATQAIILSPFNISKIEITWRRQKKFRS